jgi:hypothetical protein
VNRKRKIQIVMVFIVLGALAWAFWPGQDEGGISITYAGVSATDSNRVVFIVTNSSRTIFMEAIYAERRQSGVWTNVVLPLWGGHRERLGPTGGTYEVAFPPSDRWRIDFGYIEPWPGSFVTRTRREWARYLGNHGCFRLSQWIQPADRLKHTYGPEMLGNKPVAAESK